MILDFVKCMIGVFGALLFSELCKKATFSEDTKRGVAAVGGFAIGLATCTWLVKMSEQSVGQS